MAQLFKIDWQEKKPHAIENPVVKSRLQLVPASLRLSLIASDTGALLLASAAAAWVTSMLQFWGFSNYVMPEISPLRANIYMSLCFGVLVAFWHKGIYSSRLPWWSQVKTIAQIILVAFLADGFINFAMKIPTSRLLIAATWLFACAFVLLMRYGLSHTASRIRSWKIPTVIMAENDMATDLIMAFYNEPCTAYDVHTVFLREDGWRQFDRTSLPLEKRDIELKAGMAECVSYILNHPDNYYVICMDMFSGDNQEQLVRALDRVQAQYALVPSLNLSGFHGTVPHYYFGHDIMLLPAETGIRRRFSPGKIAKRAMDITVSAAALLILVPLFAVVAVMLKVEGQGGSVFYGGERVGRKGRPFHCWKFRSMEPDSDHLLEAYLEANPVMKARWEKYRKLPHDPRITTRTAKLIREFSIDELPQLWNVLKGDMSLVGPRPILEEEMHYFGRLLRYYLSVRPGLTGLWQVSGRNNTSFARRVYWDGWYVRNWSLWHDIIILIKTPFVMLSRKGAS